MALSLNAWKLLSMAVFTAINIIGAAIAVVMKENANQFYVSCGVLFSAGVLLAGGFVHLLVDSDEAFNEMGAEFPWAFYIVGVTIVGLACIEIVVDRAIDEYILVNSDHVYESDATASNEDLSLADPPDGEKQVGHSYNGQEQQHDHVQNVHIHAENSFGAIILTSALSIHSIIEGLGIGALGDTSAIEAAFFAVVAHKGFTSFSLAQGMVSSGYWEDKSKRKYFYISVGTFIFLNLLGIFIGWAISSSVEGNVVTATLIGITSGTFIYVAVVEILPQETKAIKRNCLPLCPVLYSFVAGYFLMAMLAVWV